MSDNIIWTKTKNKKPPTSKNKKVIDFIGIWLDEDDELESLDRISFDGKNYWSQESCNRKVREPDYWMDIPNLPKKYVFGIDVAKGKDYTTIAKINPTTNEIELLHDKKLDAKLKKIKEQNEELLSRPDVDPNGLHKRFNV